MPSPSLLKESGSSPPGAHGPTHIRKFMSTEGRDRIKEIARSTSRPELVAQEGACRMKLLTKVESMSKMQQKFNMEQRSHVSRVKKHEGSRKAGPMPSATLTFAPQSSYTQHSELGQCFEEVQQLEMALVALQKRKHALQSQEWQTTAVKPIQASGCARSQSITNMQAWFKAYGEPSGLSRWKDWRSNSPFVRSLKARRQELF